MINMFKRLISLLLSTLLFCSCTVAFAAQAPDMPNVETIYFEDGSYLCITTTVQESYARSSKIRASKDYDYYTGGKLSIRYTLNGMFTYDGSTSKATDVSTQVYFYQSGWSLSSQSKYCSGNRVYGTATFSGPSGDKTLSGSITCDKDGNIS